MSMHLWITNLAKEKLGVHMRCLHHLLFFLFVFWLLPSGIIKKIIGLHILLPYIQKPSLWFLLFYILCPAFPLYTCSNYLSIAPLLLLLLNLSCTSDVLIFKQCIIAGLILAYPSVTNHLWFLSSPAPPCLHSLLHRPSLWMVYLIYLKLI